MTSRVFLCVLLPIVSIAREAVLAAPGESPPCEFRRLAAATRSRIDGMAMGSSETARGWRDFRIGKAVDGWKNGSDDIAKWFVSRISFPVEEEARLALAAHALLAESYRFVPTPLVADRVFARLIAALPKRLRQPPIQFSLTVITDPTLTAFTLGAGRVYISDSYLGALLRGGQNELGPLAFVLAHELGHACRRHSHRRWRSHWLEVELKSDSGVRRGAGGVGYRSQIDLAINVRKAGVGFHYNPAEISVADLFAVHLCRNAGFDVEDCLDLLRTWAICLEPSAETQGGAADGSVAAAEGSRGTGATSSSSAAAEPLSVLERPALPSLARFEPLQRLRRLRMELDGTIEDGDFGLFAFDRSTLQPVPLDDRVIRKGERAVVFIHGTQSDLEHYRAMMDHFAQHEPMDGIHLLGFQYPHDRSLARSARFLKREINRVCQTAKDIDFVCHSAGGLVFRYYAEVESGDFRKAVFQGTPHAGSDLARLRPLMEVRQFLREFTGNAHFGFPDAMDEAIAEVDCQIGYDLQPDSLFLEYLNAPQRLRRLKDYYTIRGQALTDRTALLLEGSIAAARSMLRLKAARSAKSRFLSQHGDKWAEELVVPREVTHGDLAVTLESAALKGAAWCATFPVHHLELTSDPAIMRTVTDILLDLPVSQSDDGD